MLLHRIGVDSEIRLAFRTVRDDIIDFGALRRVELDVHGEGGTAHTDKTGCPYAVEGRLAGARKRIEGRHEVGAVGTVGFDDDAHGVEIARDQMGFDLLDRSGNGCMHRSGHEHLGFGDFLAARDTVPDLYDCLVRRSALGNRNPDCLC